MAMLYVRENRVQYMYTYSPANKSRRPNDGSMLAHHLRRSHNTGMLVSVKNTRHLFPFSKCFLQFLQCHLNDH